MAEKLCGFLLLYTPHAKLIGVIKVVWPNTNIGIQVQIWRILDLSGMTSSVRESRNFTKAQFIYKDGNLVHGLKDRVNMGVPFILEIRFPNGKVISKEIMVIPGDSITSRKQRQTEPDPAERFHKG